jgi:hypothetical protein
MAKRGSMLAAVAQAWHAYALQATTAINSSVKLTRISLVTASEEDKAQT